MNVMGWTRAFLSGVADRELWRRAFVCSRGLPISPIECRRRLIAGDTEEEIRADIEAMQELEYPDPAAEPPWAHGRRKKRLAEKATVPS